MAMQHPTVRGFFDEPTNTVSYLVYDPATRRAAVVDPVLDYEQSTGKASTNSADGILAAAAEEGVAIDWVLETHAHADHLSGAPYIKLKTGAKVGIGEHIRDVQKIFRPIFNATDISGDGSEFDHLFADGETFAIGGLDVEVLYTPGHTPACISYQDRRRRLHRGHAVHARLRDRAGRLPRRRCARPLSLDTAPPGASARDAPLRLP